MSDKHRVFPIANIVYPVRAFQSMVLDAHNNQIVTCRTVGIALLVADAMNYYNTDKIVHTSLKRLYNEASKSKK